MLKTHAVGIDLGTTYSCIASLNEHGEPVSIPNAEGEICTPSVVMYDRGEEIVGTEALRNAIMNPQHVVQNAKRYIGDPHKKWHIDGETYTPVDISAAILRKLLHDAERQLGKVERAVITVPAQFGEVQRRATVEAGMKAGLKQVDVINEPVAGALCYVLGAEGLWFTELADEQQILVYDLGGGTFDLSVVKYHRNEVRVVASSGDLHLGGIDWNQALLNDIADQFTREFGSDPRSDLESLQHLSWEVEQCKRSLSVRPRAGLLCQHAGKRKTYQVDQQKFVELTRPLVQRTEEITQKLLKEHKLGWAKIDVVLTTGGSSRMPMIRDALRKASGRTLNTSLSPDQSIAHGATYYAGMLLSNSEFVHSILTTAASQRLSAVKQQSTNARGLGVLVRNMKTNRRDPHYLIAANSPLPVEVTQTFGTVVDGQKRIRLQIVESGPATKPKEFVLLGACQVNGLPTHLPADSPVEVTIRYDENALVHVSARDVTSGRETSTEIIRSENLVQRTLPADGTPPAEPSSFPTDFEPDEIVLRPPSAAATPARAPASPPPSTASSQRGSKPAAVPPAATVGKGGNTRPASVPGPAPVAAPGKSRIVPTPKPTTAQPKSPPAAGASKIQRAVPGPQAPAKPPAANPSAGSVVQKRAASASQTKLPGIRPVPPPPSMTKLPAPGKSSVGLSAAGKPAIPKAEEILPIPAPLDSVTHLDSSALLKPLDSSEIIELPVSKLPPGERRPLKPQAAPPRPKSKKDQGEQEFWELVEE